MSSNIPDFTEMELWMLPQSVAKRFIEEVDIKLTDSGLRLEPGNRKLAICPAGNRRDKKARFIFFNTGLQTCRNQFFHGVRNQYGTGRNEYADIGQRVTNLLQVQADQAAKSAAAPATN